MDLLHPVATEINPSISIIRTKLLINNVLPSFLGIALGGWKLLTGECIGHDALVTWILVVRFFAFEMSVKQYLDRVLNHVASGKYELETTGCSE